MSFKRYFAALIFLAPTLFASDWPQWRGPERTGVVPASETVPAAVPAEPKVLWRKKIGEGFASPVESKGMVFYLDHQLGKEPVIGKEVLHCAKAADGTEVWSAELFDAFKDGFGVGPRCTPVVDGERVYAQSCKGELRCFNAKDGVVVWHKNFVTDFGATFIGEKGKAAGGQRHGNNGSPLIDGENIIVQVGSPNDASIVCMKKATGEVVWKSQKDQTAYAAPMIATVAGVRQLLSFTTEALIALNPTDGALLWRFPVKTSLGRHVTTPVVFEDFVCVSSHQVGLLGIKVSKDGAGLKAEQAWVVKENAINFSSPVLVDGMLFGPGAQKNIFCADIKTGETKWSKLDLLQTAPERVHAGFLVMKKNVLMLTDGGILVLFAADPKEFKELGRAQVCGFNWCDPAYADGTLYLRDNKELMAVRLLP